MDPAVIPLAGYQLPLSEGLDINNSNFSGIGFIYNLIFSQG